MKGAGIKNPARFKGRSQPKVKSLGPAPKAFTAEKAEIWNDYNADFPWLGRSDRSLVEVATTLMDHLRTLGDKTPIALHEQMRMILDQMGGTPVDRSKVGATEEQVDDPADSYFD